MHLINDLEHQKQTGFKFDCEERRKLLTKRMFHSQQLPSASHSLINERGSLRIWHADVYKCFLNIFVSVGTNKLFKNVRILNILQTFPIILLTEIGVTCLSCVVYAFLK